MPPAFVLSQNQTLKLMSDNHPGGKPEEEAGISGSRSCTSHILWICNETCRTYRRSKLHTIGPWNGLTLTDPRHPEAVADRGRRPHVPSSKPTMSKSRRDFLSPMTGATGLPIEKTQTGRANRPAGEGPYMETICLRQWLFSETSRPLSAACRTRVRTASPSPAGGRSRGGTGGPERLSEKSAARGPRLHEPIWVGRPPHSRPGETNFRRFPAAWLRGGHALWI